MVVHDRCIKIVLDLWQSGWSGKIAVLGLIEAYF